MAELYRSDIVDVDIGKSLLRTYAGIVLNTGDCKANRFGANIIRAGEPVDISGCTVLAYFMRPNLETLPITGAVEGNTVYVDLPAACYAQDGTFSLAIKVSSTDITQTVRVIDGCIRLTQTDNIVDPGEVVPTLDELFAKIADMEAATAEVRQVVADAEAATKKAVEEAEAAAEKVTKVADSIAPAIHLTASGGVAHADMAAARLVVSVVAGIQAVQMGSGVPSPDNIRPITGFDAVTLTQSGKNMLDTNTLEQVEINPGEIRWGKQFVRPAVYAISASTAGGDTDYVYARVKDASGAVVGDTMHIVTTTVVRSYTVTLEAGQTLTVWYVRDLDQATAAECMTRTQVQVEMGSRTDYAAGLSTELSAEMPETIYAGMLNWTTGELYVTHKKRTVTTCTRNSGSPTVPVGYRCAVISISDMNSNGLNNGWCDCLKPVTAMWNIKQPSVMFGASGSGNTLYLAYPEELLGTTLESALAYLQANPPTIVYPLETPRTIQLTPQQLDMLRGCNNVWSNAGDTDITYIADTQMYIDNKFTELQNAILAQGANI